MRYLETRRGSRHFTRHLEAKLYGSYTLTNYLGKPLQEAYDFQIATRIYGFQIATRTSARPDRATEAKPRRPTVTLSKTKQLRIILFKSNKAIKSNLV